MTPDQSKFLRKMKQMQKLRRMAYDYLVGKSINNNKELTNDN